MAVNGYAYIETFGCQMNERDSEIMSQLLSSDYQATDDINQADVVVVNTCSIREKAEQKAFSLLGRLRRLKKERPTMIIAVAGCVAQQEGENLLSRMPHVDIILGPQHIFELPALLGTIKNESGITIATSLTADHVIPSYLPTVNEREDFKRFVTIMQGCNNFCTYCVVPYTRGREVSRGMEDIVEEIEHLGRHGVKEVTLLGQNVNSYGQDQQRKSMEVSFPDLIRAVAAVDAIERIRFTTSHPKDLSVELMHCFSEVGKLCPHIHLPVQSGSSGILNKMNRRYTVDTYLEKVEKLRTYRQDIAITTDIIVGFPGESEKDFRATMDLLEAVRFHGAFSFKYSDRPRTQASRFEDKVEEEIKNERLAVLQQRQKEITLERNKEYIEKKVQVMCEGTSRTSVKQKSGRTGTNHIVNFTGMDTARPGDVIPVVIKEACLHSLRGNAFS